MSYRDIHPETVKMGRAFKRETIGKHVRICLGGVKPKLDAQGVHDMSREAKTQAEMDFAVMVQKRATELLAAGELRVTAQHGLTAQALLDRRAEKAGRSRPRAEHGAPAEWRDHHDPAHRDRGPGVDVTPDGTAGWHPRTSFEAVDA